MCSEMSNQKVALSDFDEGLATRPAMYVPFPQAVPNIPVIDRSVCTYFKTGKCQLCKKSAEEKQ